MKTIKESYTENINKFKLDVQSMVLVKFEKESGINPIIYGLVLEKNDMKIAVLEGIGDIMSQTDNRSHIAGIIREASKQLKFIALAFASEAAMGKVPIEKKTVIDAQGELRSGVLLGDVDMKNVLMIHFETFDQSAMTSWEIKDEDSKPILSLHLSEKWTNKSDILIKGIFDNLIENNYDELSVMLTKELKNNIN